MSNGVAVASATVEVSETESYSYLDLLARVKKALSSSVEVSVSAEDIRPFPDQPRTYFNAEGIERLSASIDAGGQTTSGMIRENTGETRYELVDGERRWRAIQLIPESRRPLYKAKLIEADDDVVRYLIAGIANFNREGHTAIEVMETIDRLSGFDLPMREIANLLGISEMWAGQMKGLKNLEPRVIALLDPTRPRSDQLPITAAIQISKIEPRLQLSLAERILTKDLTIGRLRGEVIRVAKREGSVIRLREVSPLKQWESTINKIEVVARTAGDAGELLKNGKLNRFGRAYPEVTSKMLRRIREARQALELCEKNLVNSQAKS